MHVHEMNFLFLSFVLSLSLPYLREFSLPLCTSIFNGVGGVRRINFMSLTVMGQNLTINIAERVFPISIYNRTAAKADETIARDVDGVFLPLFGHHYPVNHYQAHVR